MAREGSYTIIEWLEAKGFANYDWSDQDKALSDFIREKSPKHSDRITSFFANSSRGQTLLDGFTEKANQDYVKKTSAIITVVDSEEQLNNIKLDDKYSDETLTLLQSQIEEKREELQLNLFNKEEQDLDRLSSANNYSAIWSYQPKTEEGQKRKESDYYNTIQNYKRELYQSKDISGLRNLRDDIKGPDANELKSAIQNNIDMLSRENQ